MKKILFHFGTLTVMLMFVAGGHATESRVPSTPASTDQLSRAMPEECIEASLENIAGDTYAIKFKNTCSDDYRVYYQVVDGDAVIEDTSTAIVHANSSNSSGTIHCSASARVKITKKEVV